MTGVARAEPVAAEVLQVGVPGSGRRRRSGGRRSARTSCRRSVVAREVAPFSRLQRDVRAAAGVEEQDADRPVVRDLVLERPRSCRSELRKIMPVRLSSITLLWTVMPVAVVDVDAGAVAGDEQLSRTVPLGRRPWIATPAVFSAGLFQSVVLLPSRVIVKPSSTMLFDVNWNVEPAAADRAADDRTSRPGAEDRDDLVDDDVLVVVARGDVDRARARRRR